MTADAPNIVIPTILLVAGLVRGLTLWSHWRWINRESK